MIIKICEFCGNKIEAKSKSRQFCNRSCRGKYDRKIPERRKIIEEYQKEYLNRPEIKKRQKKWQRQYNHRPEIKEKRRILAITKYRERKIKYWKEYWKRPEARLKILERERIKRKTDKRYVIADRLRKSLRHALDKYSKTGKIMNSRKYGINWKIVIEKLEPFPKNIKNFEIDYILPLRSFNLTKIKEVRKVFDPSNLQWLTIEENRKKGGKILT
ncbi:hypothetical protein CMI39_01315 [Candidatus Pacearchaeota archaeon]|jgi:hypothetical protein|nr:hypothetical protein [Candidatus Pacearchaeota archaeon]|tara:strand:+ start:4454 stop:5098 length:645 start_codon:yes stop_codon:yes gene_type:complete